MDFYQSPWRMLFRKDFARSAGQRMYTFVLYSVIALLATGCIIYAWQTTPPALFWFIVMLTAGMVLCVKAVVFGKVRLRRSQSKSVTVCSHQDLIERRLMLLTNNWVGNEKRTYINPLDTGVTLRVLRPAVGEISTVHMVLIDTEEFGGVHESRNFKLVTRKSYRFDTYTRDVKFTTRTGWRYTGQADIAWSTPMEVDLSDEKMTDDMQAIERALNAWQLQDATK